MCAGSNSIDPDRKPQNDVSDQGLHCFATHDTISGRNIY